MSAQPGEHVAEDLTGSLEEAGPADLTALLSSMRLEADPLADQTVADILGPWDAERPGWDRLQLRLATINRLIALWVHNADLGRWAGRAAQQASGPDAQATREVIARLDAFVQAARPLPLWADRQRLLRAEELFYRDGFLSCVLLFCSSLPECYVAPNISTVLHSTGQLVERAEHRIRSTAAMIFPVMMAGGLSEDGGSGVAQTLKVRLIHATIRNLLLRGDPARASAALRASLGAPGGAEVPPLPRSPESQQWHEVLGSHGWRPAADGLPINQEEMAYTLLTFSYVFLRSLRRLGVPWRPADEEAYLHTWNVTAHVLGVRRELMAETMDEAQVLYDAMQARAGAKPVSPDPRPLLSRRLMQTMQASMPLRVLKPFPVLMTGWLCGRRSMRELGLTQYQSLLSRLLFLLFMGLARTVDAVMHRVMPLFSIGRFVGRVLSYHLMTRLLMKQTEPLRLPQPWLAQMEEAMGRWGDDRGAPRWLHAMESRLTTRGRWQPASPNDPSPR